MRYYFIVGEASGDMHAANLIAELKKSDPNAEIRGWGGDKMQAKGMELVKHYRAHSFMGLGAVLRNIFTIFANFKSCKADILAFQPDVLVLVDYSGFNLRMAKWAKSQQLRTLYYISPQVWATRSARVQKIKQYVDKMLVILPFERDFYQRFGYEVEYVGHPLLDELGSFSPNPDFKTSLPAQNAELVALLAGSRKQEIEAILPVMLKVVDDFPQYSFVIAAAPAQRLDYYLSIIEREKKAHRLQLQNLQIVENQTYNLLYSSRVALVASGTATLETALFGLPQLVCYRTSPFLYWLVKKIIRVKYISLVNLILDKPAVTELIQNELNPQRLRQELQNLLQNPQRISELQADYQQLRLLLGGGGASARAANITVDWLKSQINPKI